MDELLPISIGLLLIAAAVLFLARRGERPAEPHESIQTSRLTNPLGPQFEAVVEALDDGLLMIRADRRVVFANRAAADLLLLDRKEILGQTVMAVLREHRVDEAVEQAFQTGEMQQVTLAHRRLQRTLRLTCQPTDAEYAALLMRDVTHLVQLERARREMVANVSHELRTPLASMRLLVETLVLKPPPDIAERMLTQIEDELATMIQLVEELQELSRIESGRVPLNLGPAPAAQIIARAVERLQRQAERLDIQIETVLADNLLPLMVDAERIGQVLLNLLHNAITWTPAGGRVTISARPATGEDGREARELGRVEGSGWMLLTVKDTGIGIPSQELERIFERFYKVDRARTREGSGTGLGLAIAKRLVERHGGRIWAESREGQGSSIHMLLPTV